MYLREFESILLDYRGILNDFRRKIENLIDQGMDNIEKEWYLEANRSCILSQGEHGYKSISEMDKIRQTIGDCRRCQLYLSRTNIVFGKGNTNAWLFIVGEGPGEEEDIQGEPFVGPAGQKLTQIIQAMGMEREDVYISNVVKCRPPGNRNPRREEIDACLPFLLEQIRVIKPLLILALGNVAAQSLLKTEKKISQLRGKFYDFQGIRLMPTYHPAFLLRNPERRRDVWEDVKMIMKEFESLLKR
jgi:DNA polymerase